MWSLTLEGKTIVFKTFAISKNSLSFKNLKSFKIVYLSMTIKLSTEMVVELEKKYNFALFGQLNQS